MRIDPNEFGLCATCVHHRVIENARGSRFVLCQLSRTDQSFRKYPRIPVLFCSGYRKGQPSEDAS